ncbi:MAG: hypothetical protein J6S32_01430 [Clostridia bacterium]|nr:hypothetical protein [Clostridia bacterium]
MSDSEHAVQQYPIEQNSKSQRTKICICTMLNKKQKLYGGKWIDDNEKREKRYSMHSQNCSQNAILIK